MSPVTSGFSPIFPKLSKWFAQSAHTTVPAAVTLALVPDAASAESYLHPDLTGVLGLNTLVSSTWQETLTGTSPPLAKPSMQAARPSWNNTASLPPPSTRLFTAHQGLHTHELTGTFPTPTLGAQQGRGH